MMTDRGDGAKSIGQRWVAEVVVLPKDGVNDPECEAIRSGLEQLGHPGVEQVRAGRLIEVTLMASDGAAARASVEAMCETLLANPVIEAYQVVLREVPSGDRMDEPVVGAVSR